MQSLWRDARAEPLDAMTEDREKYPVDNFRTSEAMQSAPVCRGWINLCWGIQGGEAHWQV